MARPAQNSWAQRLGAACRPNRLASAFSAPSVQWTNALWAADDPQTDAEWQALEDAATETIMAFECAKAVGRGPNDNAWAANDDWQAFSNDVISAAELAKVAIAQRDIEALWDAGDPLYTPCEACHIAYNPGVSE